MRAFAPAGKGVVASGHAQRDDHEHGWRAQRFSRPDQGYSSAMKIARHARNRLGMGLAQHHRWICRGSLSCRRNRRSNRHAACAGCGRACGSWRIAWQLPLIARVMLPGSMLTRRASFTSQTARPPVVCGTVPLGTSVGRPGCGQRRVASRQARSGSELAPNRMRAAGASDADRPDSGSRPAGRGESANVGGRCKPCGRRASCRARQTFASVPYCCMNSIVGRTFWNCTRLIVMARAPDGGEGAIVIRRRRKSRDGGLRFGADQDRRRNEVPS